MRNHVLPKQLRINLNRYTTSDDSLGQLYRTDPLRCLHIAQAPLILSSPCLRSPVLHLTQYWHHELHSLHRSRVGPRKCLAMGPEQLISLADWHVSWQIKVRTTIDTWLSLGNKKDLAIKCYASKSKSYVTIAAL